MLDEETIELLELSEEGVEAIEKALSRDEIQELEDALKVFDEKREDLDDEVNDAVSTLAGLLEKLAVASVKEEEEEGKKVKKSAPWSFSILSHSEDED